MLSTVFLSAFSFDAIKRGHLCLFVNCFVMILLEATHHFVKLSMLNAILTTDDYFSASVVRLLLILSSYE